MKDIFDEIAPDPKDKGDIFDQVETQQRLIPSHVPGAVVRPAAQPLPAHTPGANIIPPPPVRKPLPAHTSTPRRQPIPAHVPNKVVAPETEGPTAFDETMDAARTAASIVASPAVAALAGYAGLLHQGDKTLDQRTQRIKEIQEAFTYQPKTDVGEGLARVAAYPFELLAQGGSYLGKKTEEATSSPMAGAAVDSAINAIPVVLPFLKKGYTAGKAAIQKSEWYRKATVPERNLVVETFDQIRDGLKAQGMTDGQVDAKLARMDSAYFQDALGKRMTPESETLRPNHDSLTGDTVIPASESAKIQAAAPEVKPVVKGTPQEILQLKQAGSPLPVFQMNNQVAYLLDPDAVQAIYGGSKVDAVRQAKKDLKAGGDKESVLLGYPNRQGLKPEETIDAAVTKQGAVITDLPTMKREAEAGNLSWAAEGKPAELADKAADVADAISRPEDSDFLPNTSDIPTVHQLSKKIGDFSATLKTHSENVATISTQIAKVMGVPEEMTHEIVYGSWLHDLGKTALPEEVLNAPRPLTQEEFEGVKTHPVVGWLEAVREKLSPTIQDVISYHHEKYNGTGYPEQLQGEDIPLAARIVSAADVFEALTTKDRPYRKPMTQEELRDTFNTMKARKDLDPNVVDALFEARGLKPEPHITPEEMGKQVSSPEAGIARMKPTKYVVGLDADEVFMMNGEVDPAKVEAINAELGKYPKDDVGILFQSTRRQTALLLDDIEMANDFLKEAGFKNDVVGVTPDLGGDEEIAPGVMQTTRGTEDKAWLKAYGKKLGVEKFVSLDDRADLSELGSQHIKINPETGVTAEDMAKLEEVFGPPTEDLAKAAEEFAKVPSEDLAQSGYNNLTSEEKPIAAAAYGEGVANSTSRENLGSPQRSSTGTASGGDSSRYAPSGTQGKADTGGYDLSQKSAIELPEIVELGKELSGGKLPHIVKRLRMNGALGVFFPKSGDIKLKADIFKEPGLAERVLAHEIGHLNDWGLERYMQRGNILGRIASLKKYMKDLLEEYPGSPNGILTDADRERLKAEAKEQIKAEARPEETIIETITREVPTWKYIGITPEMVKEIWNDLGARDKYPKLYKAIVEMTDAEKKHVIVDAMKGLVHERLQKFGERIQTGTETVTEEIRRTNPAVEASPEAIAKRYRELVEEEIAKRGLYKRETIEKELKDLSVKWKPFTPAKDAYTRYRFRSEELYADATSVLLNDPSLLKQVAPTFEKAFFSYIDRKPEFRDTYSAIQQRLYGGGLQEHRLDQMRQMMDEGDQRRMAMNERLRSEGERVIDTAMKALVDERWAAKRTVETIRKMGHDTVADEALRRLEDLPYLASEVSQIIYDLDRQIMEPIKQGGIDRKDLDVYLFARRVITEEFKPVIVPDGSVVQEPNNKAAAKGHTPETARGLLEQLRKELGPEKYNRIQQIAKDYRTFREGVFLPLFEKSGYFTPEQIAMMKTRADYARFQVQKFFDEDPVGTGGYAAKIFERVGSLEDIASPFVETFIQDLAFLRAARINASKQSFATLLKKGGDSFIQPAELRYSQDAQARVPVPPKNRDLAVLKVKENGKWNYYYIAKELVDAFDQQPVVATQMARWWAMVSQPFRELFVSKNLAWLLRNIPKDFLRTLQNVDDARLMDVPSLLKAYGSTFMDVWRFTHEGERSPQIQSMLAEKSIPIKRTWGSRDLEADDEIERLLVNYGMSGKADKDAFILKRWGKALWQWLDNTASTSDVWGKVAADKWIREHTEKTDAQRITMVRNRIATPNFKNRGTLNPITNNVAMFSNVGVQGLRSTGQSFKANPGRYMWKAFNLHILPKILLAAAGAGYLGEELKKLLAKVPDYDKRIYQVVPLFIDKQGKAHYLRLPDDYEGQWAGSMTWNLIHGDLLGKNSAGSTLAAAMPYQLHPVLQIGAVLGEYYLNGNVPNDSFTGQPVMTDTERQAGGKYAAEALGKYAWNKTLSSVHRLDGNRVQPDQTAVETALKTYPLNALGSFYRISDKGEDEMITAALEKVRKDEAAAKIESDKALRKLVNGETLTPEERTAIAAHPGDFNENLTKGLVKKQGLRWASALLNARTPKEKLAIIQLMQDNGK